MPVSVPPLSVLELDQDDLAARIQSDPYFAGSMAVLEERKGITENDVQIKLGTMNPNSPGSQVGTVVIVLMPKLASDSREAPGPRYRIRYPVQVIDWPTVRRQTAGGTRKSAEEITDRIRQIVHYCNFGADQVNRPASRQGALYFDRMESVPVKEGQVSYVVWFERLNSDQPPPSCATVGIAFGGGNCSLTCSTPFSSIYYTTDGTYPTPPTTLQGGIAPVQSTGQLYTGPFAATTGTFIRAAAVATGFQASIVVAQATAP